MNIPCISTTGLPEGSWWDGEWKRVQMGKLGAPLNDRDEGHPDGPERKVGELGRCPEYLGSNPSTPASQSLVALGRLPSFIIYKMGIITVLISWG